MRLRIDERVIPVALVALAAAGGALTAALAYATRPVLPLALVGALAAGVVAFTMPLRLVYLAILLVPFKLYTIDVGNAGLSVSEALFVLSGVGWAAHRAIEGRLPYTPSPLGKPYMLLLLSVVPGVLIAIHPFPVIKTLAMWTAFVLVYQMIVADGRRQTVRAILLALAVSAAVVGLKAALDPGTEQPQALLGIGELAEGRPGGSFQDPNILATFEALGLPAAVAFALGRNALLRVVGAASFVLILAGLSLSLSRGGFLAAAGALAVMLAWRPFRYTGMAALVLIVVLQAVSGSFSGEIQQTSVVAGRLQSVSYAAAGGDPRFAIWRTTPEIIAGHPAFGIGANQFPDVSLRYGLYSEDRGSYQHAHNIPLTIAAELGLLGLAALVWVTIALVRVLAGACTRLRGADRGMAIAVAAAFAGLALQGMVDYTVSSNTVAAVMFVLAACAVVLWRSADEDDQPERDAASA